MKYFSHGIMFHHFYNLKHVKGQGAISADDFDAILKHYKQNYSLISADEYLYNSTNHKLSTNDVCITFDDSLKCQYDIAVPVLQKYNLKAFWFVYTSPLLDQAEYLEIYRHFRTTCFKNIDDFYSEFFKLIRKEFPETNQALECFEPDNYAVGFDFYTKNDKLFRFLRDDLLKPEKYNSAMCHMIDAYDYNIKDAGKQLWLNQDELRNLHSEGHIIGLHSHTHPTKLGTLSYEEQALEYSVNKELLEAMIQSDILSVSYPCNSYNEDTINIMKKLDIKIGFRADMQNTNSSLYEIPREDHAKIMKKLEESRVKLK